MRVVIVPPRFEGLPTASSQTVPMDGCFSSIVSLLMIDQRFGPTRRMFIAREGSMRALWMVAALIGIAILIFAHATVLGIVVGIAFLGLAVLLYRRPLVHRIGLGHR
jgi:hypothetical protein